MPFVIERGQSATFQYHYFRNGIGKSEREVEFFFRVGERMEIRKLTFESELLPPEPNEDAADQTESKATSA